MLKKKTAAADICAKFGHLFRPMREVKAALLLRPEVDEVLAALLWEYKDRGKKGYDLTEQFFLQFRSSFKELEIRGPERAGQDIRMKTVFGADYPYPDRPVDFVIFNKKNEVVAIGLARYDGDRGGAQEDDRTGGYKNCADEILTYAEKHKPSSSRIKIFMWGLVLTRNIAKVADLLDSDATQSEDGRLEGNKNLQDGKTYDVQLVAQNNAGARSVAVSASVVASLADAKSTQLLVNQYVTLNSSVPMPSVLSNWTAANTVTVPITNLKYDVYCSGANNTILEVLLWGSNDGSNHPNGYLCRFDGRSGQPRASFLKLTAGSYGPFLGTQKVANNAAALPQGWYRIRVEYNAGLLNIYCNDVWCFTAQDTTYTPTGALYLGGEWAGFAPVIVAPGDGLLSGTGNGWATRSSPLLLQGSLVNVSVDTFTYNATSNRKERVGSATGNRTRV